MAAKLTALKHTQPSDPELASIAEYLTNEMVRVYGKPVPRALVLGKGCQISTIYVVRKHLPPDGQYLRRMAVPIIVYPNEPEVCLVLPSRYWPNGLIDWWFCEE